MSKKINTSNTKHGTTDKSTHNVQRQVTGTSDIVFDTIKRDKTTKKNSFKEGGLGVNSSEIGHEKAYELFAEIYKKRVDAGLKPFTHSYNYEMRKECRLANDSFIIEDLYGANSGFFVFYPQDKPVVSNCHVNAYEIGGKNEGTSVPIYKDIVDWIKANNKELYKSISGTLDSSRVADRRWKLDHSREREESRKRYLSGKKSLLENTYEISSTQAYKFLAGIYKKRIEAGLEPFTHDYDYNLSDKCRIAKDDFVVEGLYGAGSSYLIFYPEDKKVSSNCHTNVYKIGGINKGTGFIPIYTDVIKWIEKNDKELYAGIQKKFDKLEEERKLRIKKAVEEVQKPIQEKAFLKNKGKELLNIGLIESNRIQLGDNLKDNDLYHSISFFADASTKEIADIMNPFLDSLVEDYKQKHKVEDFNDSIMHAFSYVKGLEREAEEKVELWFRLRRGRDGEWAYRVLDSIEKKYNLHNIEKIPRTLCNLLIKNNSDQLSSDDICKNLVKIYKKRLDTGRKVFTDNYTGKDFLGGLAKRSFDIPRIRDTQDNIIIFHSKKNKVVSSGSLLESLELGSSNEGKKIPINSEVVKYIYKNKEKNKELIKELKKEGITLRKSKMYKLATLCRRFS